MKSRKEKKEIHICQACGKEIMLDEACEYTMTKRRTELWISFFFLPRFHQSFPSAGNLF